MIINKATAILSLVPNAEVTVYGTGAEAEVVWINPSEAPVTDEQIAAELIRLQADYENKEYQRVRARQYPSINDQLDMLWHAMDAGALPKVDSFYDAIKAVKLANPKP
jgi:hypothetical protein